MAVLFSISTQSALFLLGAFMINFHKFFKAVNHMRSTLSVVVFVSILLLPFVESQAQSTEERVAPKLVSVATVQDAQLGDLIVRVNVNAIGTVDTVVGVTGPGPVCSSATRADIVEIREAAKTAALSARFMPASLNGQAIAAEAFITFPGSEPKSEGVGTYSAAPNYEAPPIAKDSASKGTDRYTVIGVPNSTVKLPPPDYKGPVSISGSGSDASPPANPESGAKQLSGGVLNGKAVSLPKPTFPPAAKAVRAAGAVSVQVLIEESGDVFSAKAVSGHPLLRAASTFAACGAKFSPTKLEGNPVKVSGIITYNFVAP